MIQEVMNCPRCSAPVVVTLAYESKKHRISVRATDFQFSCGGHDHENS